MTLDREDIDAIVEALAPRIADELARRPKLGLMTAQEVARELQVDIGWVYDNAQRLGAHKLSEGKRARLRFDPTLVRAALEPKPEPHTPKAKRGRPRKRSYEFPLLDFDRKVEP